MFLLQKQIDIDSPTRRGVVSRVDRNVAKSDDEDDDDDQSVESIDSEDLWRESSENSVEISCISAHHCPGSIMFLLKGSFGVYLHTGVCVCVCVPYITPSYHLLITVRRCYLNFKRTTGQYNVYYVQY